ncbi:MAG: universal stress protein [Nitrospirales bacterium]|nr:MAG: universal stress protein [Nitrospirales bacterium]
MKTLIRRILFATDFSPSSARIFNIALTWANTLDAKLDIVHVIGILPPVYLTSFSANNYIKAQEKNAQSKLETLVIQAKERVSEVQSHLLIGIPTDEITGFALSSQVDLIIMGTHGWTGFDRVMMRSVAERVICKAPCPVLSIRNMEHEKTTSTGQPQTGTPYSAPRHILLPIDFSDCSLDAYEYAFNFEKSFDVSVTLLHVLEPTSYSLDFTLSHPMEDRQHQNKVKARLGELTSAFTKQGLTANFMIKNNPVSEAIIEARSESGADLIVMGTHGRQGLRRLVMGNVAAAVLRQSPVPVLTVKSSESKYDTEPAYPVNIQEAHS